MQCIAALDYSHLDNSPFLMRLAQTISGSTDFHPLIVHSHSAHTERIMQQGVMRKEAEVQCIKMLNHRLVGLFADEGVSALGIHAYQKKQLLLKMAGYRSILIFSKAFPRLVYSSPRLYGMLKENLSNV